MTRQVLIVGAGMGGLAAAIASARAGWQARVLEQAPAFTQAGAGIQLGPNATRLLHAWGLGASLAEVASFPGHLRVHDARHGETLATLPLGESFRGRYGAPYATLHRADLHSLLLEGANAAGAGVHLSSSVETVRESTDAVQATMTSGPVVEADALVGADGVWSAIRTTVCKSAAARATGHLAFRAMLPQGALPAALRTNDVQVWLGPRLHVVAYPVRQGSAINLVVIVQDAGHAQPPGWDHETTAEVLKQQLGALCRPLDTLVQAAPDWRLWVLHDRPTLRSAGEMAAGRIALLGDAAHPMRPYLAQGAAMAIEDAQALGSALALVQDRVVDVPAALLRYGLSRWQRCAQVQRRAVRNGRVFHASGPVRLARNLALRWLGERLLDQPWLYR